MSLLKSNTQRGNYNYIYECLCGSHMIRLCKDEGYKDFPIYHSIEFWEYRGDTNHTLWKRICLAWRILIGKEAKFATYDVLLPNEDVEEFANAILSLKEIEKK